MKMEIDSIQWWSWWSNALGISVVVLGGIVALLAMLGWGFSWKANKLKDEALQKFQTESATLISEADAKAAEANKMAEIAKNNAATANERAATLEKEAAESRLEAEKLKKILSWRTLTASQANKLSDILSKEPGSINLLYHDGDNEALFYTYQFVEVFKKAKWNISAYAGKLSNTLIFEVLLPVSDNRSIHCLANALTESGIKFNYNTKNINTNPSITVGRKPIEGAPVIIIGSRKPHILN